MISVIIPTYNRSAIISATLDSILSQTYQEWMCCVVDDNSTDNTEAIVTAYLLKDSRFRYLKNERKKGAQGARNTGLYCCNSEWVVFFDSDNIMHPDFLQQLSSKISEDVDVVQCFSNIIDINTSTKRGMFAWKSFGDIHNQLFTQKTYVDFNQAIIRKSKVLEIGGLDEDCPSMQEWDTHIRLSRIAKYTTVEKPLLDYFVGGKDAISTDTKREVRGRVYILKKHIGEWRRYKMAYCSFVKQIEEYILRNSDEQFKKDAFKQLHKLAWDAYACMKIEKLKEKVRPLYYKLLPWK